MELKCDLWKKRQLKKKQKNKERKNEKKRPFNHGNDRDVISFFFFFKCGFAVVSFVVDISSGNKNKSNQIKMTKDQENETLKTNTERFK